MCPSIAMYHYVPTLCYSKKQLFFLFRVHTVPWDFHETSKVFMGGLEQAAQTSARTNHGSVTETWYNLKRRKKTLHTDHFAVFYFNWWRSRTETWCIKENKMWNGQCAGFFSTCDEWSMRPLLCTCRLKHGTQSVAPTVLYGYTYSVPLHVQNPKHMGMMCVVE